MRKSLFHNYVNGVRDLLNNNKAAVVMDNFKGKTTNNVLSLLEANDIYVCLPPSNMITNNRIISQQACKVILTLRNAKLLLF